MNCRRVQQLMSAWSAGLLENGECAVCEAHCAVCPACNREWELFQSTVFVVSVPCQPLPTMEVSRRMWSVCSEQIYLDVEARRMPSGAWAVTQRWAVQQPRWGWVALGSAILVFGSVWLLAPVGDAPANYAATPVDGGPVMVIGQPHAAPGAPSGAVRVEFSSPPAAAESVANYHASMPFDPFADRVGASMMPTAGEK